MQITRGVADRDFAYPKGIPSVLTAFTQARPLLDADNARTGIKVVSMPEIRWRRRDIKSVALLAQAMCKQAAVEQGAQEGWMIEDGHVTEGTSSSAYIVKDGKVVTRPLSNDILAGVTRRMLCATWKRTTPSSTNACSPSTRPMRRTRRFITSASNFVMPVVEIDGRQVGGGQPGPIVRRLREIYIDEALKTGI